MLPINLMAGVGTVAFAAWSWVRHLRALRAGREGQADRESWAEAER